VLRQLVFTEDGRLPGIPVCPPETLVVDHGKAFLSAHVISVCTPAGHLHPVGPAEKPTDNSYAERFVGTLRRECLDHVLILGERHLRTVLAECARHYNDHRPHQSLQQESPRQSVRAVDITARIDRRQVLGGLISEYRRAA